VPTRDGTFYEFFDPFNPVDLGSFTGMKFTWTGNGYTVSSSSAWEAGFANLVGWTSVGAFGPAGDESLSLQTLPFTASYGGITTTQIQISSNGKIWLGPNGYEDDFIPDASWFVTDPWPSLAPLWAMKCAAEKDRNSLAT